MAQQKGQIGGFAAHNSGEIKNCYSVVQLQTRRTLAAGFTAENIGTIKDSYYYGKLKKKQFTGGFVGKDSGNTQEHCYFLHEEKEDGKKIKELVDSEKAQQLKDIIDNESVLALEFDTEKIWQYQGKSIPIAFIPEKWIYELDGEQTEAIVISSADELTDWAKKVNEGDSKAMKGYVVLENDIDLAGKEWIPVGDNRVHAFSGIFDGRGHTVKNFVMKDKQRGNKGFFGFLKGQVYNLSVDCVIKNAQCTGGLVAQNEGGIIGCCAAIVSITGKHRIVGGLVGKNNGTIFSSYSAGRMNILAFPIWLLVLFLLLLIGGAIAVWYVKEDFPSPFAPVPYDEDAVPNGDDQPMNTDGNFVSFQFEREVDVDLSTGLCKLAFENPGNSNHNIVVQLQFSDAQATRIMGSTGRSEEEQSKIEATAGYNPETYRTVIAESGAIRPGYKLENLRLVSHDNGAVVPAGDYNAIVYLVFYDVGTNNRAMLESQLPVVIKVHN